MAGRYANQKDTGEACAYADGEKNKHSEAKRRLCSMWLIKKIPPSFSSAASSFLHNIQSLFLYSPAH